MNKLEKIPAHGDVSAREYAPPRTREEDLAALAEKMRQTGKPDACQLADDIMSLIAEVERMRAELATPQSVLFKPARSLLPVEQQAIRRLAPKITKKGKHMLWSGATQHDRSNNPQPVCTYQGKRTTVARVLYDLMIAPVASGQHVQATCDEPFCVSPYCKRLVAGRQGYRQDRRRDAEGRALCRNGLHPLPKEPVPGRTPYCPTCYQDAKYAVNVMKATTRLEKLERERAEREGRRPAPRPIEPFIILPDPVDPASGFNVPDDTIGATYTPVPAVSPEDRAEIIRKGFEDIQAMFHHDPD